MFEKQDTVTGAPAETVQGLVKWFDPAKGFGFVVADNGGPDILLHVNVLRSFGQSSVADGARVEIKVQQTDRGAQVAQLLSITPPANLPPVVIERAGFDADTLSQTDLKPARVKWFDKTKGFGFANVFGCYEDVFLHIDVLRQSGLADPQSGEALAMRVVNGERGYLAAEVRAWEAVVGEE
ncbi:cold shock domain-containing protein [Sulfitobacter sp. PS-8MA]|uniref:cold shock domain-containing protein n=1 Tax=Sulfitobacter sp. PS-8MA TaxID=3237707 RepID=UPI0034C63439